ncbi:MAG TPA: hypothetical protein VGW10_05695 [Solirubrobacteraceae bacterium]|nr:hypothetical protein [Solirubrobacteraceae bacterium]
MTRILLTLAAVAALASGAFAAERALRPAPEPRAGLVTDAGRPLFSLAGLRHGDRAERCVTLTNEGPGDAHAHVLSRAEEGDLASLLRVAVTRGCDGGTLLFSGALDDLEATTDPQPWPAGAQRRYGIAVEVAGEDDEIQGRRAVQEFAFTSEIEDPPPAPKPAPAPQPEGPAPAPAPTAQPSSRTCTTISFVAQGTKRRPVLIKRHRVDARVHAKLILRIYGAPGQQRLVLVTGLRIGRDDVLMGRRFGSVAYRVGEGAGVVSSRRPYRVRIAPGALKPGRNVVRVTVSPRRGRTVRARYVLNIASPAHGVTSCVIG